MALYVNAQPDLLGTKSFLLSLFWARTDCRSSSNQCNGLGSDYNDADVPAAAAAAFAFHRGESKMTKHSLTC